jgi:hypothetical protein
MYSTIQIVTLNILSQSYYSEFSQAMFWIETAVEQEVAILRLGGTMWSELYLFNEELVAPQHTIKLPRSIITGYKTTPKFE